MIGPIEGYSRPFFRHVRAVFSAAALVCALFAMTAPAFAAKDAAMVIDANTGRVLYDDDGDKPRYPASLTKMMTLYLTFELIEKGRLSFDDKIRISAQAAAQPPSKLGLDAGDTITVRNAVLSLVTKSANDIAVALAEHIGGSEQNFARLMTRKARALGMSNTTFRNASGLPNSEQLTTARDMLTLALRLQDEFPAHYKLFSTQRFSYAGKSYRNHNTLLRSYRGTDGIKTGYTRASGFNLVSSVHRGNKHLVAVVFGGKTAGRRNARMRTILDRSLIKASTRRTRKRVTSPELIAKPRQVKRPVVSRLAPTNPPPLPGATPPAGSMGIAAAAPAPDTRSTAAAATSQTERAEDSSAHNISIAKVRRIGVAEHLSRQRTAARQARANGTAGTAEPRSISELIASTASAPDAGRASLGMQVDGAITPAPGPATPIGLAPASQPESVAAAPPPDDRTLGRQPSTLQAQLSNILATHRPQTLEAPAARAPAATAARPEVTRAAASPALRPAIPPTTSSTRDASSPAASGTHLIQIGAYNTADEAQRQLQAIRERAEPLLARAAPVTETVTRGQRRFYRARFAGFDSQGATSACQELRRRSIDCFVTRTR